MEIQLWRELLEPYDQAVQELVLKLNNARKEYILNNVYSPIESVKGRVKSINSILEKMKRKNVSFEGFENEIEDIAGIRIICQFSEDIPKVIKLLEKRSDIKIIEKKDYVESPKQSGYRSFHLIVEYEVNSFRGSKTIRAEIQVRTMAMNFWATTEHDLQYKYRGNIPEHVAEKLEMAAEAINTLDGVMSSVRSEIIDAQIDSNMRKFLLRDILYNIEDMYKVSSKREAEKIQEEFYKVYKRNDIGELKRFAKHLDILAEGYHAQDAHFVNTEEYK